MTEIVFSQIDYLRENGIEQIYLEKVKEIRRRSHELALQENSYWLHTLEQIQLHSIRPDQVTDYSSLVNGLNSEQIQIAAKQYFNKSQYARFVLYPRDYYHELEE